MTTSSDSVFCQKCRFPVFLTSTTWTDEQNEPDVKRFSHSSYLPENFKVLRSMR